MQNIALAVQWKTTLFHPTTFVLLIRQTQTTSTLKTTPQLFPAIGPFMTFIFINIFIKYIHVSEDEHIQICVLYVILLEISIR